MSKLEKRLSGGSVRAESAAERPGIRIDGMGLAYDDMRLRPSRTSFGSSTSKTRIILRLLYRLQHWSSAEPPSKRLPTSQMDYAPRGQNANFV
jgi:hypothetical protein